MSTNGKYRFPFLPYDIQTQLMDAIYESMEERKVAIVESPTGTGKSLSIICAAIKWIQDFEDKQYNDLTQELQTLNKEIEELESEAKVSDNWIDLQNRKSMICEKKNLIVTQLNRFEYKKKRNKTLNERKNNSILRKKCDLNSKHLTKKLRTNCDNESELCDSEYDENFLDYSSDDEVLNTKNETEEEVTFVRPKIYYCSRTHSQLSQFINEIKKTSYSREERLLRTVVLSSRNNYCINESVVKLNNNNLINEKCIELQNSSQSKKCRFYKKGLINELKEEVLTDVLDIEDINKLGKGIKACPYYSTRMAIPEAEIVIIPYNILLHSATRESFGISLKDSVVIVDESHNLIETIHNIHSIELKGSHVIDALTQLNRYLLKYKTRLSAKNLMHIKQIVFILNEFIKHFKQSSERKDSKIGEIVERVQFLINLKIENLNLYKIIDYCDKSRIARKLFGFCEQKQKTSEENKNEDKNNAIKSNGTTAFLAKMKGKSLKVQSIPSNTTSAEEDIKIYGSPLYVIQEFLKALINTKTNAKIITTIDKQSIRNSSLKYILLNPDSYFKDIISECRSVILCGGTMKPFDEYIDHLFTPLGIPPQRLKTFSCGHVIPDSNLLAVCLGVGPNKIPLNYTFKNRNNNSMIEETGKTICNFCSIIVGGIVCFFPSYEFEDLYYKIWMKSGIIKAIESKGKRVFREPKKASQVSSVLLDYSRAISIGKGALLLCVVGGKMSEGINFSDDLGRGVVVVGLPYPNKNSLELQQKIQYFNSLKPESGNAFYENLCMKAVNQSIGRAIRHKNDFAVIILLDNRYTNRANIRQNLPDWIKCQLKCFNDFGPAFSSIRQFFANK